MIKDKQSTRSLIAFLVTWSFLVLTVTGIILYIVPHPTDASLSGLTSPVSPERQTTGAALSGLRKRNDWWLGKT